MKHTFTLIFVTLLFFSITANGKPVIYINQVGFDSRGPKIAVIGTDEALPANAVFSLVNVSNNASVFSAAVGKPQKIDEWAPGKIFYQADFSTFTKEGKYKLN